MKLLIVDDSAIIRKAIESFAKDFPVEIVGQATNGKEAVDLFTKLKPDIVTLDITMPEMDGLEALKQMLKINAAARIMIVSAISNNQVVIEALAAGAKHFLTKPFNEKTLKAGLQKIMA